MELTNYQFGSIPGNLLDFVKSKQKSSKYYFQYLFARTQKMFEYKGLPDTIDSDVLERYLQLNGATCITKYKDSLYCFNGSVGGEQDVYYKPSMFVISNPHLDQGFSKNIIITHHKDHLVNLPTDAQEGVLVRNDTEWIGLTPLIARYAVLMAENCLTVRSADVMLRIIAMISAPNDKVLKSAQDYLKRLENGEFGVIGDSQFSEGIKMQSPPSNNGSYLTQFIELQQYLKGSFFGELGLRANYNMKREAIGTGESTLDEDAILPLCDNMLMCRRQDMERVNSLYNTEITVNFSSAWLRAHIENDAALISTLTTNGLANIRSVDSAGDGAVGADCDNGESCSNSGDRDNLGQAGTTGDNPDHSNNEKGVADVHEGRDEGNRGSGSESEETGERGESVSEGEHGTDKNSHSGSEEDEEKEGSGSDGERPEVKDCSAINDLAGEEVVDEVEEVVEEICDVLEVGRGSMNNGFLGQTESTGDEENSSDAERDLQSN